MARFRSAAMTRGPELVRTRPGAAAPRRARGLPAAAGETHPVAHTQHLHTQLTTDKSPCRRGSRVRTPWYRPDRAKPNRWASRNPSKDVPSGSSKRMGRHPRPLPRRAARRDRPRGHSPRRGRRPQTPGRDRSGTPEAHPLGSRQRRSPHPVRGGVPHQALRGAGSGSAPRHPIDRVRKRRARASRGHAAGAGQNRRRGMDQLGSDHRRARRPAELTTPVAGRPRTASRRPEALPRALKPLRTDLLSARSANVRPCFSSCGRCCADSSRPGGSSTAGRGASAPSHVCQ